MLKTIKRTKKSLSVVIIFSLCFSYLIPVFAANYPTTLTMSAVTDTTATATWVAGAQSTSYDILLNGIVVGTVTAPTVTYNFTGLTPNTTYSVQINGYKGTTLQTSPPTATFTTAPAVPFGLSATNITKNSITLNWTESVGATSYKVYKDGNLYSSPVTNSVTITGLYSETTYSFTVEACSGSVTSKQTSALSVTTAINTNPATNTSAFAVGDYVQFGSYYGQPILWKVINKDSNGIMIFMDKIIDLKAFDAMEPTSTDVNRQTNGSNYWANSNLREWLNSNALNVAWSTQAPDTSHVDSGYNAYDTEAGFLTNFTTNEQNAIQLVTHKTVVANKDGEIPDGGTVLHTYDSTNPNTAVQNYDTAYYINTTDKIFPLSVKELNDYVYSNAALSDGATYWLTEPTADAISHTTYTDSEFNTSSKWFYFLRDAYSGNSYSIRYVHPMGGVDGNVNVFWGVSYYAYSGNIGLRDALYLKSGISVSGAGTPTKPYVLSYTTNVAPLITITNPSNAQTVNGSETVTISGIVTDTDASQTETISATINGVTKQTTVSSPASNASWLLSWSGSELTEGSYSNITVTVSDGNSGTNTATYTGTISIDKTPPTVSAPTSSSITTTSFAATASASDTSTPLQYLFNLNGSDVGTWQLSNIYNFTGLNANTTYTVKYMAKDSLGNTSSYSSGINVTTAAAANQNPAISISTPTVNQTYSAQTGYKTITITGKVSDPDANNVTVSATINGKTKSTTVNSVPTTPPGSPNFTLNWDVATDTIVEGTYSSISVTANDGAGGTASATLTPILTVDKTEPVVSGVTEGGLYNISKTITFNEGTATLNGGVFTSGSQAVAEGTNTLVVTDAAGNSTTVTFTIDKTAPIDPSISINPTTTTTGNVTVTITYSGDASVKSYNINGGESNSYSAPFTVSSNCTINAVAQDAAGNWSNEVSYNITNIDTIAPVITGVNDGGIYNTSKTITFDKGTATLNGSSFTSGSQAVAEGTHTLVVTYTSDTTIHFTIDKTAPIVNGVTDGASYNTNKSVTFTDSTAVTATLDGSSYTSGTIISTTGSHTITATDAAGNSTTVTFTIDKTAPIVTGVTEGGLYNTSMTITFNEGTATLNGGVFTSSSQAVAEGINTLVVTDAAGNSTTVTFTIDKIAPIDPSISINPTTTTTGNVTVTITYPGDASVKSYNIDGGASNSYSAPFTVSSNCTINAVAQDAAGNWSNEVSYTISNITTADTTPPIDPSISINPTTTTTGDVTVTITYPGDASVKSYNIDGGESNNYTAPFTVSSNCTINAVAQDAAGNWSNEVSYTIINITIADTTPPIDPSISINPTTTTTGNVTVTITYPGDASVKSYNIDGGESNTYTAPFTVSSNCTINAVAQDAAGNWSNEVSYTIINITTVDTTPPTVNAPTTTSTQSTSITAEAHAVDPSTPLQYLFNIDGADKTWQIGDTYTFSGLTPSTGYTIKYKAKDAEGNISGYSAVLNVTTIAESEGGTVVPAVRIQEVRDIKNNDDASDIRVIFWEPNDITKIASYKVIVSTGTLDEATAAVTTNYMVQSIKGKNRMHLIYLPDTLQTNDGGEINAAGGSYNVYVLSVAKVGYSNKISGPTNVSIITNNQGLQVEAATPTLIDIANNNNGTDLRVTFKRSKSEANIQEYRIIASTADLDLAAANNLVAARYKAVAPSNPRTNYVITLDAAQKDQNGTAIQNGTQCKVYVLAVGKNGYANVLSRASKSIKLSPYVPGGLTIRGLRAIKVGEGSDSSNIKVTFYEPVANSEVDEYRIFIAPAVSNLDEATAESATSGRYQAVAPARKGALHSVTLDAGLHDYTGASLNVGTYKVYVLTVGKAGSASRLSAASGAVELP